MVLGGVIGSSALYASICLSIQGEVSLAVCLSFVEEQAQTNRSSASGNRCFMMVVLS